jgi:hypothetical protein
MRVHELAAWMSTILRVTGSTVAGKYSAVLVGGTGVTGGLGSIDDEEDGEQVSDAESFGGLGLVSRPRVPEKVGDDTLDAEAFAMRKGGLLYPVGWRDLRLHARFPNPKPGTIALVGYGGGFLSFDDPASGGDGGVTTWSMPYAFSGGAATKAHLITLSGDGESLSIVHGDGLALTMDSDNGITMRADAQTWLSLKPGKFEVFAASHTLQGNVTLGQNPLSAVPVLPALATQASPSVFLSIV